MTSGTTGDPTGDTTGGATRGATASGTATTDSITTDSMTRERVLAVCRSNWEYRGIDDASVRAMLAELAVRLDEAAATGRTPREVVGADIKAFAASSARARTPLRRRVLRMAALVPFAAGVVLLFSHLIGWTAVLEITPGRIAFWAALGVATVALELRRGALGLGKEWLVGFAAGLPALILAEWLAGPEPLFGMPLWGTVLLTMPGIACLVAERRRGKSVPGEPPQA
ncbi:hypothetical protein OG361_35865 [Streptomyces sp. NBC_00090]|uniref:hypothetical protein n=1 Tax=Streptomyces sp. NBC_00090 TaxID=2903619 RepID=UPI003250CB76